MNEVIKALKERRSIRKFSDKAVEKSKLEAIIEAGLYAPSGMGKQGAIIVAVTRKDLRDKIAAMNAKIMGREGVDPFYGAPVILIVLGNKDVVTSIYDGSLVMGNLMNAAYSEGLGSIWIHRAKEEFDSEEGKAILKELGIEGNFEGIGHCAIGYSAVDNPAAPARKDGRVFWAE